MVSTIFETIGQAVSGFANSLGTAATSVVSLFWTAGENGGGSLTFLGTILLIALGAGLVYFVIRLIIRSMRAAA